MITEATKLCNGPFCRGVERPLSDFNKHAGTGDRRQTWCRECARHSSRVWRGENTSISLLNLCKQRAKKKGIEFSLTFDWAEERLLRGVCEMTGIAFVFGTPRHAFLPSIDRIDSSKGYTPDNCRVVLLIINQAKNDISEDDFQAALRQVAEAVFERC